MISSFPYPVHPINEAAKLIHEGEDPWFALGCFLHDWWCHTSSERQEFISEPPPPAETPEDRQRAAFCAATVEELCKRAAVASPAWTNQPEYFLAAPWFHSPLDSQRAWLLSNSPELYRRRNIFVSDNVLDNKYEMKNIFTARPAWEIWSDEELEKYK